MRVRLLSVGDELLIGQVLDTNAHYLAGALTAVGAEVCGKATVGDTAADIARALAAAGDSVDAVIMTGGLGPTADDRTVACLAAHTQRPLELDAPSWTRIQYIFREVLERELTGDQRKQAMLPRGATALINERGTAPGVYLEHAGVVFVALPGVPREMQYLVEHEVLPRLLARFPVAGAHRITIHTAGLGETEIATRIADLEGALPPTQQIAYLPALGTVRVRVTATAPAPSTGDGIESVSAAESLATAIEARLPPEALVGRDDTDLVGALHVGLRARGWRMAAAESCTGGQVASLVTSRPGASGVFWGAVVAYDNAVKRDLLDVDAATLAREGAVSESVVEAMVRGAIARLGVDCAVATSGVAGPGGGTDDKPVGTVWLAAGSNERVVTRRLRLSGDRATITARASTAALDLLRRFLLGHV